MKRPFDPYGAGEFPTEQPFSQPEEEYGGCIEQQVEMSRRALAYRSRFETPDETTANNDAENFARIGRVAGAQIKSRGRLK
jgi:hypothetical protein